MDMTPAKHLFPQQALRCLLLLDLTSQVANLAVDHAFELGRPAPLGEFLDRFGHGGPLLLADLGLLLNVRNY
jgi:hypothetical protein